MEDEQQEEKSYEEREKELQDLIRWISRSRERSYEEGEKEQRLKKTTVLGLEIALLVCLLFCGGLFFLYQDTRNDLEADLRLNREIYAQLGDMQEEFRSQADRIAELSSQIAEAEKAPDPALQEGTGQDQSASEQEEEKKVHKVYLTFDDGPSQNTDEILDILKKYDVKATFFVLGKPGEANEAALKRIVEEGHSLGMHSYSHKYDEIYASAESFAEDFQEIQSFLKEVTGVTSRLYRFPGGSSNTVSDVDIQELIGYLKEQDVVYYDWNVASGDATSQELTAETIYENCIEGIAGKSTAVVLFHDSVKKGTTVEALPHIIETLLKMDNTEILPITEDSTPVQHVKATETESEN